MEQRPSPVFLRTTPSPVLPPPVFAGGPVKWVRENMLAGPGSALFTVAGLLFILWVTPGLVRYLLVDAVWSSPDGAACRAPGAGACWSFIARKLDFFLYASYPREMVWRVNLCMAMGGVLAVWSSYTDEDLFKRLQAAGFDVEEIRIETDAYEDDTHYTIWLASKPA